MIIFSAIALAVYAYLMLASASVAGNAPGIGVALIAWALVSQRIRDGRWRYF